MPKIELTIETAEVFEPLLRPARYKASKGGRARGGSWFFAGQIVKAHAKKAGERTLCVREVQKSLKESAKRLIEDRIKSLGMERFFDPRYDEIRSHGGGVISFVGMTDHTAESIKSYEGYNRAYIEEAASISKRSLELLRPTIRREGSEIWAAWNPRHPKDPIEADIDWEREDAICVHSTFNDNPWFPKVLEGDRLADFERNRERYAHIWLGEYEPMVAGAIWDRATLHERRVGEVPPMERILVAVDHATGSEEDSNEHGIIVAGLGADKRGYVLEDASTRGAPMQWATRAVAMYDKWESDGIVIERNQGGDLVRQTLKTVRNTLPIVEVVATRGKHVRAAPVASLYALGKVSHVGPFNDLEDQLCRMTAAGYEGDGSPDRCDALVWAMTKLFPEISRGADSKPKRSVERERPPLPPSAPGAWMA